MLLAGVIFSASLTGFLGICALYACRDDRGENATGPSARFPLLGFGERKPRGGCDAANNGFCNAADGNDPFVPQHLKIRSLFHGTENKQGRQ